MKIDCVNSGVSEERTSASEHDVVKENIIVEMNMKIK